MGWTTGPSLLGVPGWLSGHPHPGRGTWLFGTWDGAVRRFDAMDNEGDALSKGERIFKNTLWLSLAGVLGKGLSAFSMIYVARVLEPNAFGQLNFAMAIVSYFAVMNGMGLDVVGCRTIARNRESASDYIGRIVTIRVFLGICAFFLLTLTALWVPRLAQVRLLILLVGLSLFPSALKVDWAFRGAEKMQHIAMAETLGQTLYAGAILLIVRSANDVMKIPLIQAISALLPAVVLLYIGVRIFGVICLRIDVSSWLALLKESFPIGLSAFMIAMLFGLDTTMLGLLRTTAEVGEYSAAYKIVWCLSGFFFAYFDAIFPTYSSYYKVSPGGLKEVVEYSIRLMSMILIPLATGGTMLAKPIMNVVYGGKYDSAVPVLQILLWSLVGMFMGAVFAVSLLGCDRQRAYFKIACARAAGVVGLNTILIPRWGMIGASVATLISEVVGVPVYRRALQQIVRVRLARHIYRPVVASACMALFLFWLRGSEMHVVFRIVGGVGIYWVALYGIGGVTKEEVGSIKRLWFAIR
jgi:O-antigen/teichoic acid export membrane protein